MDLIEKYNNLDGQKVSRDYLIEFHRQLFDALPLEIKGIRKAWKSIGKVLQENPETNKFHIHLKKKIGLSGLSPKIKPVKPKEKTSLKITKPKLDYPPTKAIIEKAIKTVFSSNRIKDLSTRQAYYLYRALENESVFNLSKKDFTQHVIEVENKSSLHYLSKRTTYYHFDDIAVVGLLYLNKKGIDLIIEITKELVNLKPDMDSLKISAQIADYHKLYLDVNPSHVPNREVISPVIKDPSFTLDYVEQNPVIKVETKPINKIKHKVNHPLKNISPNKQKSLPKGFTKANEKPSIENLPGLFYLPGEIGKWLGKLQRYRLMILVHGESGAGKSELVKQLSNTFLDAGFKGGFYDLEQGGLVSKDTQESIDRNISLKNQENIAFTDEAENGLETVKSVADNFDFIVIDSWQKLGDPMSKLDSLRKDHPNTIWIPITQETTDGKAKGGSATVFDPPVRIKGFKVDNTFVNNYSEIMKNRGNQETVGTRYNMFTKKVISDNPKENSKPEKTKSAPISGDIVYSTY